MLHYLSEDNEEGQTICTDLNHLMIGKTSKQIIRMQVCVCVYNYLHLTLN